MVRNSCEDGSRLQDYKVSFFKSPCSFAREYFPALNTFNTIAWVLWSVPSTAALRLPTCLPQFVTSTCVFLFRPPSVGFARTVGVVSFVTAAVITVFATHRFKVLN
jgi:hypothetical protein